MKGNHYKAERDAYNVLASSFQGEYRSLEKAYRLHGSWEKALQMARDGKTASSVQKTENLEAKNIQLLMRDEPVFPAALREIPWPPFALYIKGMLDANAPAIAIVGTRKASAKSKAIAHRFAMELSKTGITIISGLALGIDRAAHEGALEAKGKTVAVLANGLDRVYPREHENLGKLILKSGGTLVSEYPPGSPSYPNRFIERNRLISGLALGILIIEVPAQSGALATARFALEQNRDVFVVPGDIDNRNYDGSHELIKQGAALVTSPEDILRAIGIERKPAALSFSGAGGISSSLDETSINVVTILKEAGSPLNLDEIAERTKIETSNASRTASLLMLQGIIKEENGKYYI
mgnify:CR=1 FL=1